MRTIDIHAHISPAGFIKAFREGGTWHGMNAADAPNMLYNPRTTWTPEGAHSRHELPGRGRACPVHQRVLLQL